MNKTLIYLSFLLFLLVGSTLPNLLRPEEGVIFVIEEVIGFVLLSLGCLLFLKPVRRIIDHLNVKYPWQHSFSARMFREGTYLLFAVALLGSLISSSIHVYLDQVGLPKAYQEILIQKKQIEHERTHRQKNKPPPRSPHHRAFNDDTMLPMPFDKYTLSAFAGSFILFGLLFGVEELFDFNKRRNDEKIHKEALLKEHALMQANILQKQLNPHFMFNSLNVLSGLIHEDIDKSERFIKELSQIYRYTLEHSEAIVSTLEEEIEYITSYFYLLKIRFEEKLYYTIKLPKTFMLYKIPTLTLEVLVENAVKHNIVSKTSPLKIEIFTKDDCLVVKNNLQIRTDSVQSHGVGLRNLRKRLELLGIHNASFEQEGDYFVACVPLLIEDC